MQRQETSHRVCVIIVINRSCPSEMPAEMAHRTMTGLLANIIKNVGVNYSAMTNTSDRSFAYECWR